MKSCKSQEMLLYIYVAVWTLLQTSQVVSTSSLITNFVMASDTILARAILLYPPCTEAPRCHMSSMISQVPPIPLGLPWDFRTGLKHVQPGNWLTTTYTRSRDQALRTQSQSCLSGRIQADMPNHLPSCSWPSFLPAQGWTCLSCPDVLVGRIPGLFPLASFSQPEMSSFECLFATPELVHPQRPPYTHPNVNPDGCAPEECIKA